MSGRCAILIDASERGRTLVARVEGEPWRTRWLEVSDAHLDTGLPVLLRTALDGVPEAGLDAVVVTMGPGSYTGVRAAAAAAAGLAAALGVPLHGLSSLELAAAGAAPGTGTVWAAVDVGRGRLAVARVVLDGASAVLGGDAPPLGVEAGWAPPDGSEALRLARPGPGEVARAAATAVAVALARPPLDLTTDEPATVRGVTASDPHV
ncbi:MAG TPA: tRNA (adenosine(37)-N6)-threonylcarbamoyltransferase complex dimerization subunit type 1 TsaB [Candidatus Dormibacteraeota bacterium]|nr:tRNA (adenosine(37)-N6)-threonylcarbamoyltransferase complex dimerization subunit type 1 TsaB [Candidatus Dormibacteraeota bacterium]